MSLALKFLPVEPPLACRASRHLLPCLGLCIGCHRRGSAGRLRIVRQVEGKTKQLKLKLDELVQPNDTLVVRERLF